VLYKISKALENPIRGSDLLHGQFYLKIRIYASISAVHNPNYPNLVSNDWSHYKEQDDTCLVYAA